MPWAWSINGCASVVSAVLATLLAFHFGFAAVIATDPHLAEAAAQQVIVDYGELPAVFDEVEAMTSTAIVHDELKPAGTFADLKHLSGRKNTNISLDFHLRKCLS